jgi:uncharacterized protein (TIGR00369 family)
MPKRDYDETWPYLEQFTPARAADQQETMGRLPLLRSMGLRLEKLDKDYTKVSIEPRTDFNQTKGMLQGGILATLVDTAAAQALRTTLKLDHDAVTVHLDTKYFRPVYDERVFAEGSVVRKGRNLAHIDVAVVNEGGTLVARGWCVLKLTRRSEPIPPEPSCDMMTGGLGI